MLPTFRHCAITVEAGIATLCIQEAGPLNILGTPVIRDVRDALRSLHRDGSIRVAVLRGTGDRAFSGGADVKEMSALTPETAEAFIRGLHALCDTVRRLPVPVIARIPGWCLGGALELVASCDLRVAATGARFAMPEIKVGIPSVIEATLLPRFVGAARARLLVLTGDTIDAQRAAEWGLVETVVEPSRLDEEVGRIARLLASHGPSAVRAQKTLLREWDELPLDEATERSVDAFRAAYDSGEPQRYMQAFLSRQRAPGPAAGPHSPR